MSSKSRKGPKTARSKSSSEIQTQGTREPGAEEFSNPDGDDEVVHVPKGKSRLRFIFILGLMVFTLIIFTVGDMLPSSMGTSRGGGVFMTWKHPTLGEQKIEGGEFIGYKRGIDAFFRVAFGGRFRIDISDEDVALEIIHDQLAQEAGIVISNAELGVAIIEGLPGLSAPQISSDFYTQNCERARVAKRDFEAVLARKMRIARWEQMRMSALALASPEQIEAAWKENHQEYAYEYISLEHTSLMEQAAAALPDDEALTLWFDELPTKPILFAGDYTSASAKAEMVGLLLDSESSAAGLLERYPRESDPEQEAQSYFNTQRSLRFRRDEQLVEGDEGYDDIETRIFLPFDEVTEQVEREAPVYYALRDWLADLKERASGGEEIDLIAEAADLGLDTYSTPELLTKEELEAIEGWGSPFMSSTLLFAPEKTLAGDVTVTQGAILIGRTLERVESAPPEFTAVKERVVELWKEQKLPELATEKLQAMRDALWVERSVPPEDDDLAALSIEEEDVASDHDPVSSEAFAAAAQEAGSSVGRRDWLENNPPVGVDLDYKLAAHEFIAQHPEFADLEEGQMSEVLTGAAGEFSYLVLAVGQREPEVVRIDPGELESIKAQASIQAYIDFREQNMTGARYSEVFELRLRGEDDELEPVGPAQG